MFCGLLRFLSQPSLFPSFSHSPTKIQEVVLSRPDQMQTARTTKKWGLQQLDLLFSDFFPFNYIFFLRKKIYIQICFRVETKSGSTVCLCALKSVGAAPHQLHPAGGWEPGRLPPSLPSSHGSPWKAEHKFKPFKEWLRLLLITALHGIEWFGWWWFIEVIYNMLRSVNGPHQAQSRWIKK